MNNSKMNEEQLYIFDPWNSSNKLITLEQVRDILKEYDIDEEITDLDIFQRAFVHKSYITKNLDFNIEKDNEIVEKPDDCLPLQDKSYERLEYLGDAILSATIASYLYERFPEEDEGFLTRMRTKLVNGEMLGSLGLKMGFGKYLIVSRQIEENNGRESIKVLEDLFEAFIGALYLEFNQDEMEHPRLEFYSILGYQVCQLYIINVIEKYVDFSDLILNDTNFKDKLMKHFQRKHKEILKFKEILVEGTANNRSFTMCVKRPDETILAYGKGASKKKAEQEAAKNALIKLDMINV